MQKFKPKHSEVEAVQFDPHGKWPEVVKPWTEYVPRDMSFGYIEVMGGRLHIHAGDWIVKDDKGNYSQYNNDLFNKIYEQAK